MPRLAASAIFLLAVLAVAAPASAFDEQPMNELLVGSSLRSIDATAGPGCVFGDESHACTGSDEEQPLAGTLFLRPRHQVALDFDWPVQSVRVSEPRYDQPCANCFRPEPARVLELAPVGGAPARRWTGTVPAGLPAGFMRWSISANYDPGSRPTGNRTFEAGVHVLRPGRERVVVPRLVGKTYAAATRELERRGLRWRRNGGPRQYDSGPPPAPGAGASRPEGRVTAQGVRPGRRVSRGATVRLTVEA